MTAKTNENYSNNLLSIIKRNYRLQYVENDDLIKLIDMSHAVTYPAGSYVFMEGDTVSFMYIVVSGKIELNMNNHRFNEKIFSILGPGNLLGLSEIFNCHGVHTTNALCEEDCVLAAIPKADFRASICQMPSLTFAICIIMGNMIGELRHELSLTDAQTKVMAYLKNLIYNSTPAADGSVQVPRKITYDKLAKMLNITRETTSRVLKIMKDKGIIDIQKDSFTILDIEKINEAIPEHSCLTHYHDTDNQLTPIPFRKPGK